MKFKVYLAEKDLTLKGFADSIGVSSVYLSQVVKGKAKCSPRLAKDIEQATDNLVKIASVSTAVKDRREKRLLKKAAAM